MDAGRAQKRKTGECRRPPPPQRLPEPEKRRRFVSVQRWRFDSHAFQQLCGRLCSRSRSSLACTVSELTTLVLWPCLESADQKRHQDCWVTRLVVTMELPLSLSRHCPRQTRHAYVADLSTECPEEHGVRFGDGCAQPFTSLDLDHEG